VYGITRNNFDMDSQIIFVELNSIKWYNTLQYWFLTMLSALGKSRAIMTIGRCNI